MANTPISTYKQVTEFFRGLCSSHLLVKSFSVGDPSDIDVETNLEPYQRFPLVFLVPQQSSFDRGGKLTFNFTMVVADIAENDEELQINTINNCLMILQDIASRIIQTTWSEEGLVLETPINFTPWTEKFNNNLSGVSAEIAVVLKSPFNNCDSAFRI